MDWGSKPGLAVHACAAACGMASMRRREAIEASGRSRSWSKGVLWEAADVDEMAVATPRTDARRGIGGSGLMAGLEIGGRGGRCRSRPKRLRWGFAIELQEEAGLSGEMAFARV